MQRSQIDNFSQILNFKIPEEFYLKYNNQEEIKMSKKVYLDPGYGGSDSKNIYRVVCGLSNNKINAEERIEQLKE